jgi:hypothetical protein
MVHHVDDGEFGSVCDIWLGNDQPIVRAFREIALVTGS